jgi:hypothetical protein
MIVQQHFPTIVRLHGGRPNGWMSVHRLICEVGWEVTWVKWTGWQDGLLTTSNAGNGRNADEGQGGCGRRKLVGCNNSVLTCKLFLPQFFTLQPVPEWNLFGNSLFGMIIKAMARPQCHQQFRRLCFPVLEPTSFRDGDCQDVHAYYSSLELSWHSGGNSGSESIIGWLCDSVSSR